MTYSAFMLAKNPNHQFTAQEFVQQVTDKKLVYFEPGAGYHYSNTGYAMLGEIIARIYSFQTQKNKTYTDFIEEHITGGDSPIPQKMHFPYLATDQTLPSPNVCGTIYTKGGKELICKMNMSGQVAEGNGYGTMSQVNRHIRSLMRGENVLTAETISLMQNRTSKAKPTYGLGCEFGKNLGYGHNGARVGNLSFMAYNPVTDVSVVAYLPLWDLSNGMDSFIACFKSMYEAAYAGLETLGYPGKPK
jgi:D-alanyl-D-alanine carboxypeptidase